ncbi:Mitochondrial import inner membrane translocase subunit TIM13, partial [Leucoagaricus sp. SymC.cos]
TRKEQIMQQIKTELALAQAQELMSKASEKCFNKCVPKPGSSLSASEQTCLSRCLDRYMDAFNIVSKTYVAKLNKTVGGVDNIFN